MLLPWNGRQLLPQSSSSSSTSGGSGADSLPKVALGWEFWKLHCPEALPSCYSHTAEGIGPGHNLGSTAEQHAGHASLLHAGSCCNGVDARQAEFILSNSLNFQADTLAYN